MSDTRQLTIEGQIVTLPQPYSEGHSCTKGEADALNQTLAENVRNNLAKKVKEAPDTAQTLVDTYLETYQMGARIGGVSRRDPVEKEMYAIAEDLVKKALAKKGVVMKDYDKEQLKKNIEDVVGKNAAALKARAEQIVAARAAAVSEEITI